MRTAAVVVNPISGSGSRERALVSFRRVLEEGGFEVRVRPTRGPGDAAVIAGEEARDGTDVVVAAGGDGTVNEVASGLVDVPPARTALAILPRGTSNLVARDLLLPFRAERAARVVLDGRARPLDVGLANGRLFVACVGVGWDAHVVRLVSAARKGHIGFHTWAKPILKALAGYRFEPLRVSNRDGAVVEGVLALFFNTRPYAAFFRPAPDARSDDGLLDAVVFRRGGALDLPRWTVKGLRGTLPEDADVSVLRSTRFRVDAERPLPWQVDGDVGAETPVDILVRPAALRVLVPRRRGVHP